MGCGWRHRFSPATQDRLYRTSINGGAITPLTTLQLPEHTSHRWPFFLPDGKHFLYLAINHDPSKSANDAVYYASVDGSVNRLLFKSKSNAIYADGYLIFARNEQLLAQPFNLSSGTLSGEPQLLAKDVANDPTTWHMDVAASNNGLLLYGTGGGDYGTMELFWVDRTTKKQSTIAGGLTNVNNYSLSPQGDRIALEMDNGVSDIWALPLEGDRKPFQVVPTTPSTYRTEPKLSPNGRWLIYRSNESGSDQVYVAAFKGGTGKWQVSSNGGLHPAWSHDGKELYFANTGNSVWVVPVKEVNGALQFGAARADINNWSTPDPFYQISPDGKKMLLYQVSQQVSDSVTVVSDFSSSRRGSKSRQPTRGPTQLMTPAIPSTPRPGTGRFQEIPTIWQPSTVIPTLTSAIGCRSTTPGNSPSAKEEPTWVKGW